MTFHPSVCPHDCPSVCALEVEKLPDGRLGRVRGSERNAYTAGVICAKVARYHERYHHPDRLGFPLRRKGAKGSGDFERISWEAALDEVAEGFARAEQRHGSETVWPYWYAGTMGLVNRDGINRLTHAKRWSRFKSTICVMLSDTGFRAGHGRRWGVPATEIGSASDLVVVWGCNPVSTHVNLMSHIAKARKERGAKLVVVDPYRSPTAEQADVHLALRPGTDGALACGVMHVLFAEGFADRDYLARYADVPDELERHLRSRTPAWASAITGLPEATIREFARLYGATKRSYLRLGYGFTRSRNGAAAMHAASCLPVVTGAWQHEGGGALYNMGDLYRWDKTTIEGLDVMDPATRLLDQSRIGPVLTGDPSDLAGGPPVDALLDPVHQPDVRRSRSRPRASGVRAAGSLRLRAGAVPDRDGRHGRHRAAGDHVPGARGRLPGGGAPDDPGAQGDLRALRRVPIEPFRRRRAGEAAGRRSSGLRDDALGADRRSVPALRLAGCGDDLGRGRARGAAGLPHRTSPGRVPDRGWPLPLQARLGLVRSAAVTRCRCCRTIWRQPTR